MKSAPMPRTVYISFFTFQTGKWDRVQWEISRFGLPRKSGISWSLQIQVVSYAYTVCNLKICLILTLKRSTECWDKIKLTSKPLNYKIKYFHLWGNQWIIRAVTTVAKFASIIKTQLLHFSKGRNCKHLQKIKLT